MVLAGSVCAEPAEEPVDLVVRSEVTIQQKAAAVWPRLLDFASWKSVRSLQRVAGDVDEEGYVRLLTPCGATEAGSYFVHIVKLIPRERLVIKLAAKDGKALLGFAAFELRETDGQTKVVYDTYIQYQVPGMVSAERRAMTERLREAIRSKVDAEQLVLKAWVEGRVERQPGQCS